MASIIRHYSIFNYSFFSTIIYYYIMPFFSTLCFTAFEIFSLFFHFYIFSDTRIARIFLISFLYFSYLSSWIFIIFCLSESQFFSRTELISSSAFWITVLCEF
jgi:hypothetical protein